MESFKEVAPQSTRAIAFALALATTAFIAVSVVMVVTGGVLPQQILGA